MLWVNVAHLDLWIWGDGERPLSSGVTASRSALHHNSRLKARASELAETLTFQGEGSPSESRDSHASRRRNGLFSLLIDRQVPKVDLACVAIDDLTLLFTNGSTIRIVARSSMVNLCRMVRNLRRRKPHGVCWRNPSLSMSRLSYTP